MSETTQMCRVPGLAAITLWANLALLASDASTSKCISVQFVTEHDVTIYTKIILPNKPVAIKSF